MDITGCEYLVRANEEVMKAGQLSHSKGREIEVIAHTIKSAAVLWQATSYVYPRETGFTRHDEVKNIENEARKCLIDLHRYDLELIHEHYASPDDAMQAFEKKAAELRERLRVIIKEMLESLARPEYRSSLEKDVIQAIRMHAEKQ